MVRPRKGKPMTTDSYRSRGPAGAQCDHRLRDGTDALGFGLVPLTQRHCPRNVQMRGGYRIARGERAGHAIARAAAPAVSPTKFGRSLMPHVRGTSILHALHHRRNALASTSAIVALALTAGLW